MKYLILCIVFIGCTQSVGDEEKLTEVILYCDRKIAAGVVIPDSLANCSRANGVCRCPGIIIDGKCSKRMFCFVPDQFSY